MKVIWLFGLIRFPIRLERQGRKKEGGRAKRQRKPRKQRKGGGAFALRREFWPWLYELIRRILAQIHIYSLFLKVRLGLGDPADTGRLWAFLGPVAALLASIPLADISLQPNFVDAEFRLESRGRVRLVPITILGVALATLLSPATWRVFRQRRNRA